MKRAASVLLGLFVFAVGAAAWGEEKPLTVKPENLQWTDIPGMAGWKQALLFGDPAKPGPYVLRYKVPANATVPAHSHPDTENLTVLSGAIGIGEGARVDKANGQVLGVGAFYRLPANTVHFAWSGPKGATVQIHGDGPSGMTMEKAAP